MNKLEKQILKNQIEIMGFLSGFRTLVENMKIDGKAVESEGTGAAWVFTKCREETKKLLEEK